jgi:hypothetical protein
MGQQGRDVVLLIDNFLGHFIQYVPKNVEIVYFTPNITSHIQPLDAGVIRCYKAHHKRLFCKQALDLDDANKPDIYKINLLKAMRIAEKAWALVSANTFSKLLEAYRDCTRESTSWWLCGTSLDGNHWVEHCQDVCNIRDEPSRGRKSACSCSEGQLQQGGLAISLEDGHQNQA